MTNLNKSIKGHKKAKEFWAIECIERDNRRCKHCNLNELASTLVVHHLDESRKNGYKSMNNNLNNLILLCKKCHAKIHGQTKNKEERKKIIFGFMKENKTYQEIGNILGVSRQRVFQIIEN